MISRESIYNFLESYPKHKECKQDDYGRFRYYFDNKKEAIAFVEWLQDENFPWIPIPTPLTEQQLSDLYNVPDYIYHRRGEKTYFVSLTETQSFELLRQALLVLMVAGYFHQTIPNPSISSIPNQTTPHPLSKESKDQKSLPTHTTTNQTPVRQWNNFMQSPLAKTSTSSVSTLWNISQRPAPLKLFSGTAFKLKI